MVAGLVMQWLRRRVSVNGLGDFREEKRGVL
jgi:hypothetical protein